MASINGTIFDHESGSTKLTYLKELVSGVNGILQQLGTNTNLMEIRGISKIFSRITTNFRMGPLLQIPELTLKFCDLLNTFTCNLIQSLSACQDLDALEELEASFDLVLEAWVILVCDNPNQNVDNFSQRYCKSLWTFYLEARLKVAQTQLDQETALDLDDFQAYDEQLTAISFLGRREISHCLSVLDHLVQEKMIQFQAIEQIQNHARFYEEIHWLLMITGHLMADSGAGEVPLVPDSINQLSIIQSQSSNIIV